MTTEDLCARAARGEGAAFTDLAHRYARQVRAIAVSYRWAADLADQAEVRQAVLIGFWRACKAWSAQGGASFPTFAERFARCEVGHLLRAARSRKVMMVRAAESLEQPYGSDGGDDATLADVIPAPEAFWDPSVLTEIREDLRTLSRELPQSLSQVEHEALARVMLDETLSSTAYGAHSRVREKASHVLKYGWAPVDREREAARKRDRALEMLSRGMTHREVAKHVCVHRSRVGQWVREARACATA